MSYDLLLFAFSFLIGSWFVLAVRIIQFRRKINFLEASLRLKKLESHNTIKLAAGLSRLGKSASSAGIAMSSFTTHHCSGCRCYEEALAKFPSVEPDDYADKDKDGVPDAFQRRRPLSEILEFEKDPVGHSNDYWVAIELPPREPRKGEYVLSGDLILKCSRDFGSKFIILKTVPGTDLDDLVDLTK